MSSRRNGSRRAAQPGNPVEIDRVLGRRFTADVARGTALTWDLI
ncbi:hypothetical protein [Micromonospora andamanensis]|nr:hypothetical protein [Micromonospora andamanensis]